MKATARMDAVRAGEEGIWFPFTGTFEVLLRYLSPRKMKDMKAECTTTRRTAKGIVEEVDEDQLEQQFLDYIIGDWRGGVDTEGNDWPCSDENKRDRGAVPGKLAEWAGYNSRPGTRKCDECRKRLAFGEIKEAPCGQCDLARLRDGLWETSVEAWNIYCIARTQVIGTPLESGAVLETLPVQAVIALMEVYDVEAWRMWFVMERVMACHEQFAQSGRKLAQVKSEQQLKALRGT
jgi:hypothetical protein